MTTDDKMEELAEKIINQTNRQLEIRQNFTVDGIIKSGEFTAKLPSLLDRIHIGVSRAKYLEGTDSKSIDVITDDIAYMSAYLDTVLIKRPKWFSLEILSEYNELRALYEEVAHWENSFRQSPESDTDSGSGSKSTDAAAMEN